MLIGLPYVLFVFCLIVISVISHFGLECGTLALIASVRGYDLSFTFYNGLSGVKILIPLMTHVVFLLQEPSARHVENLSPFRSYPSLQLRGTVLLYTVL